MRKYIFLTFITICFALALIPAQAKEADLAGSWYSAEQAELESELGSYLSNVQIERIKGDVVGVIVPHAGFRFSGPVAAYAYKILKEKKPSTVILVGFTHRRHFPNRIAVFTDKTFVTPLGGARIDMDITKEFIAYGKNLQDIPQAFISENSIEMQIPFIQTVLKDARLVIIALGDQKLENCRFLANALYEILHDKKDFVIVASSDMSHYLRYENANTKDAQTIEWIKEFSPDLLYAESLKQHHELMCGVSAVYTVTEACKKLGADEIKVLKYANSGDTAGDKSRVVGYLSAAFVRGKGQGSRVKGSVGAAKPAPAKAGGREQGEKNMFSQTQREELLKIARNTIQHYLKTGKRLDVEVGDAVLKQDMGAFVTLRKHGSLRGCIGHMVATGPIYLTVRDMAISAAIEDPRFKSMTLDELKDVDIEISVLSPMEKIDDYNKIETGKHGVMVRQGFRSGVYLPQVADETGWNREEFMNSLCGQKAGINPSAWKTGDCDIYVFTAEVFKEDE